MKAAERWLAAVWPVVRGRLPASPAQVVEIGCGALGGFVPMLHSSGYEALGVDPEAPEGAHYRRVAFERVELMQDVADAVIASTSLHHVADPADVLDRIATTLVDGGRLVVIEWAWEDFDEVTAAWCFERLGLDDEAGWLHRRRHEWLASGQSWSAYLRAWAREERLHSAARCFGCSMSVSNANSLRVGPISSRILPTRRRRMSSRPSTRARFERRGSTTSGQGADDERLEAAATDGREAELRSELEMLVKSQNASASERATSIPATFLRVTVAV